MTGGKLLNPRYHHSRYLALSGIDHLGSRANPRDESCLFGWCDLSPRDSIVAQVVY